VTCGNADAFRALPPVRPRNQDPSRGKPSSAASHNDGRQAVVLPGGRCSYANICSQVRRPEQRLPSGPLAADDALADVSHFVIGAPHLHRT